MLIVRTVDTHKDVIKSILIRLNGLYERSSKMNKIYARFTEDGKCIQTAKIHLLGIGKYSFQTSLFGEKPYENNINMPMFDRIKEAENWIEKTDKWMVIQ
jgi:hypothetical protein